MFCRSPHSHPDSHRGTVFSKEELITSRLSFPSSSSRPGVLECIVRLSLDD